MKTKTTKNSKTKKQPEDKKLIIILLISMLLLTGALIACIFNIKTSTDKEYLDVYEHLLRNYIIEKCPEAENYNTVCLMKEYGVSKDGDPYVTYIRQKYDQQTHEKINEEHIYTLYFQHRKDAIDGYSEALSY